jgi:hypothetical protein
MRPKYKLTVRRFTSTAIADLALPSIYPARVTPDVLSFPMLVQRVPAVRPSKVMYKPCRRAIFASCLFFFLAAARTCCAALPCGVLRQRACLSAFALRPISAGRHTSGSVAVIVVSIAPPISGYRRTDPSRQYQKGCDVLT